MNSTTNKDTRGFRGNCYGFKVKENEVLIQDLRPCIDPKGTVCMYDMVTKKYFYNQGTGTLTAGNIIKFVDYIIFDGNSYIDTGVVPVFGDKLEIYASSYSASAQVHRALFSAGTEAYQYIYLRECRTGITYYKYFETGGARDMHLGKFEDIRFIESFADGSVSINGQQMLAPKGDLTAQTVNTTMFIGVRADKTSYWIGKIGSAKLIASDGTAKFDLRPCVVAGEACFYDMVTGKVFTNAGTGTLKASGRFVESIIFDGASYINTGISYQDCTVECGLTCPVTSGRQLMGWFNTASTYWGITNGQFELGGGYVLTKSDTTKYSEVKIEVAISDRRYLTLSHAGNSIKREGNIGSSTSKYAIGALPNTYAYGFIGNFYFHRFNSPDGVLIQDLRPYVDENGVACFKDIVTGNLFYNQGTGTLTYTEK